MQDTRNIDPVQIVTDIVNVCPGIEIEDVVKRFVGTLVARSLINAIDQGKVRQADGRYFSVAAPVSPERG